MDKNKCPKSDSRIFFLLFFEKKRTRLKCRGLKIKEKNFVTIIFLRKIGSSKRRVLCKSKMAPQKVAVLRFLFFYPYKFNNKQCVFFGEKPPTDSAKTRRIEGPIN